MEIEQQRAADPHRRDGEDPAAHLPGRQLVRRTAARQPVGADGLLGRHDPDHPDLRPGAARPGARRAEHRHAREPAEVPDRLRRRPDAQADAGRRTPNRTPKCAASTARRRSTRPTTARPKSLRGGAIINQALTGHRTARPLETDRGHRQGDRRAERARAAARRTDRQLQHLLRRLRGAVASLQRDGRRAADARSRSITRGLRRAGRVVRPDQDVRARHPARASKLTPATVKAPLPWIEQVQASLGPERARRRREGPRRSGARRWRKLQRRTDPALQADRSLQQVPDESDLPGGQHEAAGRLEHARASRTTRSSGTAWSAWPGIGQSFDGNGAVHQVPGRQQRPDAASRGRPRSSARTSSSGCEAARALAAARRWARARPSRPPSRPTSRWCPATSRRCPNSTARCPRARRTGAELMNAAPSTATKAGSASATRSSATARRSSRSSR